MKLTAAWAKRLGQLGVKVDAKPSKMGNTRTEADGYVHPSKRQAERWANLLLLQRAKRIRKLSREVPFTLTVNGFEVCKYIADHVYEELQGGEWLTVVEDVKGWRTPIYRLKKRLMRACHGITVREV